MLQVWARVTVSINPEFSSRIPESLMIGIRNPVSENWNQESKTVLDYLLCGDWLETGRFDTNSSSEIIQKFWSLHVKFAIEQEKHFGWISFVEICLKRSTRLKKWRQTAATARLLYPLNLSNVDDCFWSWILKDFKKKRKRKFVLVCSGPPSLDVKERY